MERNKQSTWGTQDVLQAKRGLFRAITPQHLAEKRRSCWTSQKQQPPANWQQAQQYPSQSPTRRQPEDASSEENGSACQLQQLQQLQQQKQSQEGNAQKVYSGHQPRLQQQEEQKLSSSMEQSVTKALEKECGIYLNSSTPVPCSRPWGEEATPTFATVGVACDASSALRRTAKVTLSSAKAFERTKIQRCHSSPSSPYASATNVEQRPLPHLTTHPTHHQNPENVPHFHLEQERLAHAHQSQHQQAHELQHPHLQRQQPSHQRFPRFHHPQCQPETSGLFLPKSVPMPDSSFDPAKVALQKAAQQSATTCLQGTTALAAAADDVAPGTGSLTANSAAAEQSSPNFTAAATYSAGLGARLPVDAGRIGCCTTASPSSRTRSGGALTKNASDGPADGIATATACNNAPNNNSASAQLSKQASAEDGIQVQQEQQGHSSSSDSRVRQPLEQLVCAQGAVASAAATQTQTAATVGAFLPKQAASRCVAASRCPWLQSSIYNTFSEIVTQLVCQQQLLSRSGTALRCYSGLPNSPATAKEEAPDRLCNWGAEKAGNKSAVKLPRTVVSSAAVRPLSATGASTAHKPSSWTAAAIQTRGIQQQGEAVSFVCYNPFQRNIGSAAPSSGAQKRFPNRFQRVYCGRLLQNKRGTQQPQLLHQTATQASQQQRHLLRLRRQQQQHVCQQQLEDKMRSTVPLGITNMHQSQQAFSSCCKTAGSTFSPSPTTKCTSFRGARAKSCSTSSHIFDTSNPRSTVSAEESFSSTVLSNVKAHCTATLSTTEPYLSSPTVTAALQLQNGCTEDPPVLATHEFSSHIVPSAALVSTTVARKLWNSAESPLPPQSNGCNTVSGGAKSIAGGAAVPVLNAADKPATFPPACQAARDSVSDPHAFPRPAACTASGDPTATSAIFAASISKGFNTQISGDARDGGRRPLLPQLRNNNGFEIRVKTYLDLSSYSLDSPHTEAVRDTLTTVAAPGPLLLLFAFYSRMSSIIEKEYTCGEPRAPVTGSYPRIDLGERSTVSSNSGQGANASAKIEFGDNKNSSSKQARGDTFQASGSCGSSHSSGIREGTGTRKVSRSSGSTSRTACGRDKADDDCEGGGTSTLCGSTHSNQKRCGCDSSWWDNSAKGKLPLYVCLSCLLQEPVSFEEERFGLLEAQKMVKHFSLHLPPFSITPAVVEELWELILLTTGTEPAIGEDSAPGIEHVSALSAETAQAASASSVVRRNEASLVARNILEDIATNDSLLARARPSSVAADCVAGCFSRVPANSKTAPSPKYSPRGAAEETKPRPATCGVYTTAAASSPPTPFPYAALANNTNVTAAALLVRDSRQLRKQRLNFLGFTAFFAALAALATRGSSAVENFSHSVSHPSAADPCSSSTSAASVAGTNVAAASAAAAAASPRQVSVPAPTAGLDCIIEPDAAVTANFFPECDAVAAADVRQQQKATSIMHGPMRRESTHFNFQCVQHFMQPFGTVKAVKRFLFESYKEIRACALAAEPPRSSQNAVVADRTARKTRRGYKSLEAKVEVAAAAASARLETANDCPRTAAGTDAVTGVKSDCRASLAAKAQKAQTNSHMQASEGGSGETTRKGTIRSNAEAAATNDFAERLGNRRSSATCIFVASLQDSTRHKEVRSSRGSSTSYASSVTSMPALYPSPMQSIFGEFALFSAGASAPAAIPTLHLPVESSSRGQRQHTRLPHLPPCHMIRRSLWGLLPNKETLQWLLRHYTFEPVIPVWLPFAALFIDMGVQRVVPPQQHKLDGSQQSAAFSKRFDPVNDATTSTQTIREICDIQQQRKSFSDFDQPNAVNTNPLLPAETDAIEQAGQSFLAQQTSTVSGDSVHRLHSKQALQKQNSLQEGFVAPPASSATARAAVRSTSTLKIGANATAAAAASGEADRKVPSAALGGTTIIAAADPAFCVQKSSQKDSGTAHVDSRSAAAFRDGGVSDMRSELAGAAHVAETVAVSPPTAFTAAVCSRCFATGFENCPSAASSARAASADASVAATFASVGGGLPGGSIRPRARVADCVAVSTRPSSAASSGEAAREEAAAATVAKAEETMRAEMQSCSQQLPPSASHLARERAAQQWQWRQDHVLALRQRAKEKARRHRFAIEIQNITTQPMTVVVNLENLPPVEAARHPWQNRPLLLVPGCSKRIILDVPRTHTPGEWLGFAHLRIRSRRSSSLPCPGQGGACSSSSGCCCHGRSRKLDKTREDRIHVRSCGAQSKPIRLTNKGANYNNNNNNNNRERRTHSSSSKWDGSDSGGPYLENAVSIPIYLRLVTDHTHDAAVSAPAQSTGAAAKVRYAAAVTRATAILSSESPPEVVAPAEKIQQKGRKQRQARSLSPLPLHANRETLAAALAFFNIRGKLQNERDSQQHRCSQQQSLTCQQQQLREEQQRTQQQNQQQQWWRRQPKQQQQQQQEQGHQGSARRRAASACCTSPAFMKHIGPADKSTFAGGLQQSERLNVARSGCTSSSGGDRQSAYPLEISPVVSSTSCLQFPGSCCDTDGKQSSNKIQGCLCTSPSNSSGRTSLTEQSTRTLPRSDEGSTGDKNNVPYIDKRDCRNNVSSTKSGSTSTERRNRENSGSACSKCNSSDNDLRSNSSSNEGRIAVPEHSRNLSQRATPQLPFSPSISITSSEGSRISEEDEEDENIRADKKNTSNAALASSVSALPRLNAREYDFLFRTETLERLFQSVPDCFKLGQLLQRQQQLALRSHTQQRDLSPSAQQIHTQLNQLRQPAVEKQQLPCRPPQRQLSGKKQHLPQQPHIRWLRGHLLYGRDPLERKGWAKRAAAAEAASAAQPQQQRRQQSQETSTAARNFIRQAKPAKAATTPTLSNIDDLADYRSLANLPCSSSLYYYDTRNINDFRCSGCGLSVWGKFKDQKEDSSASLCTIREEQLREASTASCSTSAALPGSVQNSQSF